MRIEWGSAVLGLGMLAGLLGAPPARADIYTCTDPGGRRITSDRPIAACRHLEQRLLNPDGSLRRVVPPTPTVEERAAMEARQRQRAIEIAAHRDAVRRDRNLIARYPDEAPHRAAREAALDDVRNAMASSRKRLADLQAERKRLHDELEFYVGRPVPAKLRQQLDANEAATAAQHTLMQNQQAELVRINALYDVELERLKKLWAGAAPGSIGPDEPVRPVSVGAAEAPAGKP